MEVFALVFLVFMLLLIEISSLRYLSKFNSDEDVFELQVIDKQIKREKTTIDGEEAIATYAITEVLNLTTGQHEQIRTGANAYAVGNTYKVIKVRDRYYRREDYIMPMILAPIVCIFIGFILVMSM